MGKKSFDKGFIPRLVGEDREKNLDDLIRKTKPGEKFEPIQAMTGHSPKQLTLAQMIWKDAKKVIDLEMAELRTWADYDVLLEAAPIDNILTTANAFTSMVGNLRLHGLFDPKELKEIVDGFIARLRKIKLKNKGRGYSISKLMLQENVSDKEYIRRVLKSKGCPEYKIKSVLS